MNVIYYFVLVNSFTWSCHQFQFPIYTIHTYPYPYPCTYNFFDLLYFSIAVPFVTAWFAWLPSGFFLFSSLVFHSQFKITINFSWTTAIKKKPLAAYIARAHSFASSDFIHWQNNKRLIDLINFHACYDVNDFIYLIGCFVLNLK